MNVVVRSNTDPTALTGAVKQQLHELETDLPLYNVVTSTAKRRRQRKVNAPSAAS
jgi:hypothetical protein